MKKKSIFLFLTGLATTGMVLPLAFLGNIQPLAAAGTTTFFHYESVAATCTSYGIKEYWTDCKGQTTIVEPVGAVITEKGQPSAAEIQYIIDTYGTDDERLIAPVEHSYVKSLAVEKIGYFGTVCSVCGEAGAMSSDVMLFDDIDFTVAQYGAQGGKWGTNVQPTATTMTYEVTAGNEENEIKLPKINFSLYKTVKFTLSGNVWDARVGLESGSYAFPYSASGNHSGTLSFAVSSNQVAASLECSDGVNQNLVITDSDIISGNKSVSLFMIADDAYRAITAELIELADSCAHNYVVSTEKIGAEVCSICGDERDYGNDLSDIDFTAAQYGAQGGKWGTNVQPGVHTMMFEALQASEGVISLPKINFNSFDYVKFSVSCGSFAIGAGLISGDYVLPGSNNSGDPAHTGVLTLTLLNSNQLKANLVCNENSQSQTVIIEDQDVINGNKSVNMYMYCEGYEWQTVTIELTNLADSCTHNYVADPNCIGKEVCSICGLEKGIANPTLDFTSSLYGAYDLYEPSSAVDPGWTVADGAGTIKFCNAFNDGTIFEYHLPRMYFAGFSSVTIDVAVNYEGESFAFENNYSTSWSAPFSGYTAHLVFENITSSSMTVKLNDAFNTTQLQITCANANVLNGNEGFVMFAKGSGNIAFDAFSNFTFVA